MKFVDALLSLVSGGFNFLADLIYKLFSFLAKPLSYVYYFFEGVFYFLFQLFNIVVKVVMIFVGLFQLFIALVAGFVRTIMSMLTINYTAPHYPSASGQGITAVTDILNASGMLTVVPYIVLAVIWMYFVKRMIGLLGGGSNA
jgi:phage-related protein